MKFLAGLVVATALIACADDSSNESRVRALIERLEAAAEARDASDVLKFVADDYADSNGFDRPQLKNFLRGYFLAHPKLELVVSVESLEFPVDGLARAIITVTTVELADPDLERLNVEFRRSNGDWRVARADRMAR
jgi:hypothetical protein